ncbi:MAG TPA: tetratricopeptide repeat protein, partial [Candidatus Binatia bacterium]|nr:tetratricopeptide repeat protein [Candidatus Binatia bacterium]
PPAKTAPAKPAAAKKSAADPEKINETVEEVRFYLEHGMPEQASAALDKLRELTSDASILSPLESEIQAASQEPAAEEEVSEVSAVESITDFAAEEPAAGEVTEAPAVEAHAEFAVEEAPAADEAAPAPVEPQAIEPPAPAASAKEQPTAKSAGALQEFVSDLESSLGGSFLPGAAAHQAAPAAEETSQPELEPIGQAKPTHFGVAGQDNLGEFVADLESSLGEDFLKGAPVAEPPKEVAAPAAAQPAAAKPAPIPASTPVAASAAASAGPAIRQQATAPVAPAPTPAPKPPITPVIPPAAKSSPFGEEAGIDLAEMFGELKQDLEAGAPTAADEDPETHYNLGIAFREMGLLDEAIGELQKTCQAVDRGHPFPQVMQTYTWLAQCFLDKGVPEAAIRWYHKALEAAKDEETRIALYYELAAAHETAGDKTAALKNFMEVYGRNIDYRDVAERIKALKS